MTKRFRGFDPESGEYIEGMEVGHGEEHSENAYQYATACKMYHMIVTCVGIIALCVMGTSYVISNADRSINLNLSLDIPSMIQKKTME